MTDERAQRRLMAILAADVVGFATLNERDETGMFHRLRTCRKDIFQPEIERRHGRIFKLTGDGLLAEFTSAVDAVECAVALQQAMTDRNRTLPEEQHIEIRIGINLGDVILEGEDRHGDGVVIASRLEALAEPGGICLSAKVHDEVNNKINLIWEDRGEQHLKNINRSIHVFRVSPNEHAAMPLYQPSSNRISIAVLPFDNFSDDPSQRYFSDGITEDIITELSRFSDLAVVARNATFQYRGKSVDVKKVGRELGAQYVLEGSVRRLGERLRITAQLIDSKSGNHLWAERYDRRQEDIFSVQDDLVRSIVGTLVGRLNAAGAEQALRKPPANLMAYECVLRGNALPVGDRVAEAEARRLYEKAVQLDPSYALAHALLAYSLLSEWFRDLSGSNDTLQRALELAKKAVQLDESNSSCLNVLAWVYLHRRAYDLAEYYYQRALDLNPNNPYSIVGKAEWLTFSGKAEEALHWFKQVRLVDPHFNPSWWWRMIGVAHFMARQYDEAIAAFGKSPTPIEWVHAYVAASHALSNRQDKAREAAADVLRLCPTFSIAWLDTKEPYKYSTDRDHLLEGLRKAGLPE